MARPSPACIATMACAVAVAGCTTRIGPRDDAPAVVVGAGEDAGEDDGGSGGPPPGAPDAAPPDAAADGADAGPLPPPPPPPPAQACARVGEEVRVDTPNGASSFAFAWDVDHYVLVYADPTTGDVYATQLTATGAAVVSPTCLETTEVMSTLPSLVRTKSGWVVAWQEGSAGHVIRARALDVLAQPAGDPVTVASTESADARPVLSPAPNGVAIAWMDSGIAGATAQLAILDDALTTMGPAPIAPLDQAAYPWLAGDDASLAVLWSDKAATSFDLRFAFVDSASLATHDTITLRSDLPGDAQLGRMIRAGEGWLAAWEDTRAEDNQIFAAAVGARGEIVGGGLVEEANTGDTNWPNLAWDGAHAAVVYYQWRGAQPQVFLSRLAGNGQRLDGPDLQVSSAPDGAWARYPDVQWTGNELGVAWIDTRDGSPQIYFARVSCAGQ